MPTEYTGQNDEITAQVGEEFIIALESNPTTGYAWEAQYDSSILQLVDRRFSPLGPTAAEDIVFQIHVKN
jgi:inhibitor of cysteine peptidase